MQCQTKARQFLKTYIKMADSLYMLRGTRKIKREASSSGTSIFSGNSTINESNGGRPSHLPGLRNQKFVFNNSSDKCSFNKEKNASSYENYEAEYSVYLLRKLQKRLLEKSKTEKEENLKKSLVSLKFELEDSLSKHVDLSRILARGEMYYRTIKECNKRIQLGKVLEMFEENQLDDLFQSVSKVLDRSLNQLPLVGISKSDVESVFNSNIIGEGSQLVECLKSIQHYSNQNKENIDKIATEIVQIEKLLNDNSVLRERYNNILKDVTSKTVNMSYETLTEIVRKGIETRLSASCDASSRKELFEFDELLHTAEKLHSPEAILSQELPEGYKANIENPIGSSTPYSDFK